MEQAIVISPRVVERLRFMDPAERRLIFDTLISDEVLCESRQNQLTVDQELNYMLVRDMIMRDSCRYATRHVVENGVTVSAHAAATLAS